MLMLSVACGCAGVDCHVGETRCSEGGVEICNGSGRWAEVADCREVSAEQNAPWTCCAVSAREDGTRALHACLPAGLCMEGER